MVDGSLESPCRVDIKIVMPSNAQRIAFDGGCENVRARGRQVASCAVAAAHLLRPTAASLIDDRTTCSRRTSHVAGARMSGAGAAPETRSCWRVRCLPTARLKSRGPRSRPSAARPSAAPACVDCRNRNSRRQDSAVERLLWSTSESRQARSNPIAAPSPLCPIPNFCIIYKSLFTD